MFKSILAVALLVSMPAFAVVAPKANVEQKRIVVINKENSLKAVPTKALSFVRRNVDFAARETLNVITNHKTATIVLAYALLNAEEAPVVGSKVTSLKAFVRRNDPVRKVYGALLAGVNKVKSAGKKDSSAAQ